MSTRKKGDEALIVEGSNAQALPSVELASPIKMDAPSDGQAVAAEFIEAQADGPITGDGSGEACPPIVNDKGILSLCLSDSEISALAFPKKEPIPALWIRAVPEQGFWRCGMRFTREGIGIALSALTESQIEQLQNEPNLIVEFSEFSDSEPQP